MTRVVVAPVNLGCCADAPRCLLCPPPPSWPTAAYVSALVDHYATERALDGETVRVGFYGGPPPTEALIEAIGGRAFVARVRPDLLSRSEFERLRGGGAVGIELDALTFDDGALQAVGRRHRRRLVLEQLEGIREAGIEAGIVLAPGLPGTDHAMALRDAHIASTRVDFARLHPVLVLADAGLREAHMDGRYVPLTVGQAITTCQAMMECLEGAGVKVVRVGQNPGPDGLGRAVAGPRHPSLRQLVEARRVLATLQTQLYGMPEGSRVAIRCHPADETRTRGPYNQHIRNLRAAHGLAELLIRPDPGLSRGQFVLHREEDG